MSTNRKSCTVNTCARPHLARGYCKPHYRRWAAYGDPLAGAPLPEEKVVVPDGFKQCGDCKSLKQLDDFSRQRNGGSGRSSQCKDCHRETVHRLNQTPKDQRRKPGGQKRQRIDRSPGSGNELNPRVKYPYPGDEALRDAMRRRMVFADVAKDLGVPWSCLKDWLNARPVLKAELESYRPKDEEQRRELNLRCGFGKIKYATEEARLEARRRSARENARRYRAAEPEKHRAARREQMRKYGPEYRRRWNHYNRLRREKDGGPMTRDAIDYLEIIKGDPCSYCGSPMEHADHIHPIYLGGDNSWDNFAPACAQCNMRKHAAPLLLFLLTRTRTAESAHDQ